MAIKISKPSYDVLTTGNINLSFNSELATHSIYNVSTITLGTGVTSGTISHNLGYPPKAWVFLEDTKVFSGDSDGTAFLRRIPCYVDYAGNWLDYYVGTANLVINKDVTGTSYTFKAIIFTRSPSI
jgi:hypothetical protein